MGFQKILKSVKCFFSPTVAIGTGFYTGISSYKGACRKMILQLENSQLKDYMLSVENKAKRYLKWDINQALVFYTRSTIMM